MPKEKSTKMIQLSESEKAPAGKILKRVSGHDVAIGRDERQIIVCVDGTNTYHRDYFHAFAEIKRAISSEDSALAHNLEELIAAENNGWLKVNEMVGRLARQLKEMAK